VQCAGPDNHLENLLRPWAMGRKAWLFVGSEIAGGQRAAIVMSLAHSAKLNAHDPWRYLKDVLERLPAHPNRRIEELLPHRWQATPSGRRFCSATIILQALWKPRET
jgi:transposase